MQNASKSIERNYFIPQRKNDHSKWDFKESYTFFHKNKQWKMKWTSNITFRQHVSFTQTFLLHILLLLLRWATTSSNRYLSVEYCRRSRNGDDRWLSHGKRRLRPRLSDRARRNEVPMPCWLFLTDEREVVQRCAIAEYHIATMLDIF